MKEFIPKFYPTSVSMKLKKKILWEYYVAQEPSMTYDHTELVKDIEQYFNEILMAKLEMMRKRIKRHISDPKTQRTDNCEPKFFIYNRYNKEFKEDGIKFAFSLINCWKNPDVKKYHSFLYTLIAEYDSNATRKEAIAEAIYNTWFYIDVSPFLRKFNNFFRLNRTAIKDEIIRIERDHIEKLL